MRGTIQYIATASERERERERERVLNGVRPRSSTVSVGSYFFHSPSFTLPLPLHEMTKEGGYSR